MFETTMAKTIYWIAVSLPSFFHLWIAYAYRSPLQRKLRTIEEVFADGEKEESLRAKYNSLHGIGKKEDANSVIFERFNRFYDWKSYLLPTCVNCLTGSAVMILLLSRLGVSNEIVGLPKELASVLHAVTNPATHDPLIVGLLGAIVWGLYDMMRRFHVTDLTPTSLNFVWLRVLIVGMLAYVLSQSTTGNLSLVLAFAVGVFPIQSVRTFLIGRARESLKLQMSDQPTEGPTLYLLQGATESVVNRLSEEGIDSTQAMAYVDPVAVLFKTNIEWEVILDLIDQALLSIYIGDKVAIWRSCGVRGAIDGAWIGQSLGDDSEASKQSERVIRSLAAKIEVDELLIRELFENLGDDPRVDLIWSLWLRHQDK